MSTIETKQQTEDMRNGKSWRNTSINSYAQSKIDRLEQENTKLRIALCNLRDEFLDLGGDPNQLELFDKDDVSQLSSDLESDFASAGSSRAGRGRFSDRIFCGYQSWLGQSLPSSADRMLANQLCLTGWWKNGKLL